MNKKILLFTASLGMVYLAISGNSAGPATMGNGNLTGSGGPASCSGGSCHASGSAVNTFPASTSAGIVSLYSNSTATALVTGGYVPGTKYYVKLTAGNKTPLPKFGFQVSCVSGTTTKVNAGTLAAMPSSNTVVKTGTINVIEHTKALSASAIFQYEVIFEWTAPPAGTGDVTFYAMVNAVNNNGLSTGDEPSVGMTKTFYEKTTSIGEIKNEIASKIYPNPCTNVLNIEAAGSAKFMATVYDLAGRVVIAPAHQSSIDVSALTSGVYLLRLNTEDGQQTATFVKQ
ncbi:MAG: choice-of-anchor V domain-containing protein [Bacteroidota bacterium]